MLHKSEVFQNSQKITSNLGYFCSKIVAKNFQKSPNLVTMVPMIDDYIWNWHDQQCDQNWRNFAALALFERSKHLSKLRIYFGKCYCAIGQYFIAVNGQILIKWGSYLVTLNRPVKNRIVMAIILYLPPSPPGSRESVISSSCLFSKSISTVDWFLNNYGAWI